MGITKPVGRPSCGDMYEKLPTRPLVVPTSVRSTRVTGRGAIVVGSGLIRAGLLALAAWIVGMPTVHAAEIQVVGTRDDSVLIAIVGAVRSMATMMECAAIASESSESDDQNSTL